MDIFDIILEEEEESEKGHSFWESSSNELKKEITRNQDFDPHGIRNYKSLSKKKESNILLVRQQLNLMDKQMRKHGEEVEGAVADFLRNGIEFVWREDAKYQESMLKEVLSKVREVPDSLLDLYYEECKNIGMFANFQDDYLYGVYGENVYSSEYGLYNSTRIDKYAMRVMIPLTYLNNEVCGFIGYAPALLGEETITNKYIYPNSDVLPKAKIMFCPKGVYADAIRDGYVCIVDGIFDAIILNAVGIHAASLCGSSLTKYHKLFLSAIRTKIVVPDNDVAGTKVVQLLENAFDRVRIIFREDSKDVDDFMKIPGNLEKFVKEFYEWKQSDFCGSMYMRSVTRGDTELFNREALRLRRDSEDERQTIGITDIVSGLIDNYNS